MRYLLLLPIIVFADIQTDYDMLVNELRCMACSGQVIGQSEHPVALAMRKSVLSKLESGMSAEEVSASMQQEYGEQVSIRPTDKHYLLWSFPFIILALLLFRWRRYG